MPYWLLMEPRNDMFMLDDYQGNLHHKMGSYLHRELHLNKILFQSSERQIRCADLQSRLLELH